MILTWENFLALTTTLVLIGMMAEKMWGWLWIRKLKIFLIRKSNKLFDMYFIPTLHDDINKVLKLINKIFGSGIYSIRLFVLSTIPFIIIFSFSLINEAIEREILISKFAINTLIIMTLWTILTVWISFVFTKFILKKAKKTYISIFTVVITDIIVAYILIPIPFFFTMLFVMETNVGSSFSVFGYLEVVYNSWPSLMFNNLERVEQSYEYINFYALVSTMILSALPTIFHIVLILKDILNYTVFRYVFLGIAEVLNYLAEQKYPVTKVLTGIMLILGVFKLWMV